MSRSMRVGLPLGVLALLVVLALVTGIVIARTEWFRNTVRQKIVATAEEATGGHAEMQAFTFDWRLLRAQVRGFVLHGLEPDGAAPLFRAELLQIDLKLTSPFKGTVDIASLVVDTPQANVIIFPDGRSNIPAPKIKQPSDKTGLETIVELAVRDFDLRNGSLTLGSRRTNFNARGENLRAHLNYSLVNTSYTGEIDIKPLYVQTGAANQVVNVAVNLPIVFEKDKITLSKATLTTSESNVAITGSVEHLVAPRASGHIQARVAVEELRRATGLTTPLDTARGPRAMEADITASNDESGARIDSARVTLGGSTLEASGAQNIKFTGRLQLEELGRLFKATSRPEGAIQIRGSAAVRSGADYSVTSSVTARGLALSQNRMRVSGMALDTSLNITPDRIDLRDLRLAALGGNLTGSATIEQRERFRFAGELHNFNLQEAVRPFLSGGLGYAGIISGPLQAQGNIHAFSTLTARTRLSIAPGSRGVPVSGRIEAAYDGRGDLVTLGPSYLALPSTRIDLSGSLGRQIEIRAVSRNLTDLQPALAAGQSAPPAMPRLNHGSAVLTATVTGRVTAPQVSGHLAMQSFTVEERPFTSLTADFDASNTGAVVRQAVLARDSLQIQLSAAVGLRDWKAADDQPLKADAIVRNADVQDALALAGRRDLPITGALTADAHLAGTVGAPRGELQMNVVRGTAYQEPFDEFSARATLAEQSIDVPAVQWIAGTSRIDANGLYQHPAGNLRRGTLRVHVASNAVELERFQSLVRDRPGLGGRLSVLADATGTVEPVQGTPEFRLASLNGNASARGLRLEQKNLGDFTATASTSGSYINYTVNSDLAGSSIRLNGRSQLAPDYPTTATADIRDLPIERVLALAGRRDLPVAGTLALQAKLSGTWKDPHGSGTVAITKGAAYEEVFDRLQATLSYDSQLLEVPTLRVTAGPSDLEASARLVHPLNDFRNGQVEFRLRGNRIQLERVRAIQRSKPGLSGVLQLTADGAATLNQTAVPGVLFSRLNANLAASGVAVNTRPVGQLTAVAETRGSELTFTADSDFAKSAIHATGKMQLQGDYPIDARLAFQRLTYAGLSAWTGTNNPNVDGSMEGQATLSGPVRRIEALQGMLRIDKLEAHSVSPTHGRKSRVATELHNAAPVVMTLDRSTITVQNASLAGPLTNLNLAGTASLAGAKSVNLKVNGKVQMEILEAFNPEIFSKGNVTLNAVVAGTLDKPLVNGRLQLQEVSLNMLDVPNGIEKANGTVTFSGTQALIQDVTAESGGGQVTLSGTVGLGGPEAQFRIQATARRVRVLYPENVSTRASARLTLAGTTSKNKLSGTVTVSEVSLHSHTDVGSILSEVATPPVTENTSEYTGLLGGMSFDIQVETAPGIQFRTALTQDLEADARLTLRGTPSRPGMLGRANITGGDMVFFGSKYTIDQGSIAFYNPLKIDPILNMDLSTEARGVEVVLSVSGPMNNLKLTYHSDPPLQFTEIVSLLASGKAPTSDPVLAARQPAAPEQSLQQLGASTMLGQAVANPVSGRLQRLFGVSKLKIDPQITGADNTPQARLTIEQQVTRTVVFTYIQDVTSSNPQILRVEWAIDPAWSAIAQRQTNGELGLDLFFKKRFR